MDTTHERVTYATLAAGQTPEFHRRFDEALSRVRADLGARHPHRIDGREVAGEGESLDTSPIDTRVVVGRFPKGTPAEVDAAVRAARAAFPAWSNRPYRERTAILRRAADLIEERGFDLSALVCLEVGKSRLEAMGDVTETADLVRYYCEQMERNDGFDRPMARFTENEETRSVLRPYGVWGVISPFNFPAALLGGPVGGALVAGNTVVVKPSHEAALTALAFYGVFREAGVPAGALHLVFGGGTVAGQALANHPDVDGMLFTGSKAVGMDLLHRFSRDYPKPCITEMGGKNPAIVMPSADLDAAAEGVMRSAFGLSGQKCSACSRVYVHEDVRARFTELLLAKTAGIVVGDPSKAGVFLGPVIHERAFATYEEAAAEARRDGKALAGARSLREGELAHGFFVAPTVVELAKDHRLFRDELFVPFVALAGIGSLEEGIELGNRTEYGLTAGFFSQEQREIDTFLERIQAGVVYVNRRAGATTGAWPGVQPFGGWKASGSSGKASGGLYYVQQFLREQSRTIVH
jgi:1-pyrroline-5-carboxylate dehydrogenase